MRTQEFFDLVKSGRISDLDIYNHIQEITDNFDGNKLNLLCNDFDFYLFMAEEEAINYSTEEIEDKIQQYHDEGKEIPMLSDRNLKPSQISEFFETPEHKKFFRAKELTKEQKEYREQFLSEIKESKKITLDVEKLMDPHGVELFCLLKLRNLLVDLKREHTSATYKFDDEPKPQIANSQHISWLKSDDSLEQFINALQEQNLVQSRDTKAIINNHFKPVREQNSKPEPIKWLETTTLLAYMIEQLDPYYIKPKNIWSDTAPHFSVNGKTPKNLRQTSNRFKQNKSSKPKHHKLIDNIIKSLSD